jgi:hypothetical protein
VLVGDLEEPVPVVLPVHVLDGFVDHPEDGLVPVTTAQRLDQVLVDREAVREVAGEDVCGGRLVGSLDLDLHVEAAGPQDRRVDEVLPIGGPDHNDVAERLDAVDLGQQLRHDRGLDV